MVGGPGDGGPEDEGSEAGGPGVGASGLGAGGDLGGYLGALRLWRRLDPRPCHPWKSGRKKPSHAPHRSL